MNTLHHEISSILRQIGERHSRLRDAGTPVPSIETDILLGLIRDLYVKVEFLKSDSATVSEEPESVPEKEFSPEVPLVAAIADSEPEITMHPEPEPEPEPEIRITEPEPVAPPAPFQPEVPAPAPVPEVVVPEKEEEPAAPIPGEPVIAEPPVYAPQTITHSQERSAVPPSADLFGFTSAAEKPKPSIPSLNEKITAGKSELTLSDKINLKPITDLKATIGINEKFQFINELFDGSSEQYNEAVARLNTCGGSYAATALMAGLEARYGWDRENAVYLKFNEYITRRYL